MSKNNRHVWADLPKEMLELIGKRLETRIDVLRFRAICTTWRSVVPLTHSTPTLSLHLNFPPPLSTTATLSSVTVYRLEDETRSSACLIKVTESTSGEMKIMNPFYSRNTWMKNSGNSVNSINILGLRVVEVIKGYRLKFNKTTPFHATTVKKVVLFGNSGVVIIYGAGKLGYFEFKDEKWTDLGNEGDKFDDVVVYNGQNYVVDYVGTVYWVDGRTISLVQFSPPLIGLGQCKNLVVSGGELFVVDSYFDESQGTAEPRPVFNFERVDLRVFRLDEEWGNWVEVKSLGDRVIVLGKEVCYSVSTKDFPGCDGNGVYFVDSRIEDRRLNRKLRPYFVRVFDIGDRRRMKTVDCFPSFRKLFSLSMNFPVTSVSSSD